MSEIQEWKRNLPSYITWDIDTLTYKGKGTIIYAGMFGEGKYVYLSNDGEAIVGEYENAVPHIGVASFLPKIKMKLGENICEAFVNLEGYLGISFMLNL